MNNFIGANLTGVFTELNLAHHRKFHKSGVFHIWSTFDSVTYRWFADERPEAYRLRVFVTYRRDGTIVFIKGVYRYNALSSLVSAAMEQATRLVEGKKL